MTLSNFAYRLPGIFTILLRWRLTGTGRHLRRNAERHGYRLTFGPLSIHLHRADRTIIMPSRYLLELGERLADPSQFESRLIFRPRGSRQVADMRRRFEYLLSGADTTVDLPEPLEMVDVVGGYLKHARIRPGDLVFDAGAYAGEVTIMLARMVGPTGRVVAFEPNRANIRFIERNLARAGITNVTIEPMGLWSESTQLKFNDDSQIGGQLMSGREAGGRTVPVISLVDACRRAGGVPSFVKMDIEGAEVEVVEAARSFIAGESIQWAIASYHHRNGRPTSMLLEPMFREMGYRAETGWPGHPTTWACPES